MGALRRLVAIVVAVVAGCAAVAQTSVRAAVVVDELLVRLYDNVGVPDAVRDRAMARAGEILSRAELEVAWLECPSGGMRWKGSRCTAPPKRGELIVRLVKASSDVRRAYPHSLGYSLVDTTTGAGTLATVFTDRVDELAERARHDRSTVLGRAIAHELGHLLLGTTAHTAAGLMRQRWTVEELARDHARDWQFTPIDRDALHATLQARTGTPSPPGGRGAGGGGPNPHVLLNKTP